MEYIPSGTAVDRGLGDEELLTLVRSGDPDAFALLYRRHVQAVLGYARKCSRRYAEDLCAEAFTSTLRAIRNGYGPCGPLRPYLAASIRHTAAAWSRRELAVSPVGDLADLPDAAIETDPVLSRVERDLVVRAFNSLPERWRSILTYTVIDARSAGSAAKAFRIEPQAACSLAYRAREGLRQAYLQAHIERVAAPDCQPYAERLAAFVRQRLGTRRAADQRRHLVDCAACSRLLEVLLEIEQCLTPRAQRPGSKPRPIGT